MRNAQQISGTAVEETRRQLAFIEDPAERLRLMFANNLKDDVWTELNALINKGVYFGHPSRTSGVQLDSFKFSTGDNDDSIVCSVDESCHFSLPGVVKFFGWKKREVQEFIERLLTKVIEINPLATGRRDIGPKICSWEVSATRRILEKYRPKDKKFAECIECWILLAYFYDKNIFLHYLGDKWYKQWLNLELPQRPYVDIKDHENRYKRDIPWEGLKYAALARRLQELGMSKEEVHEAFYNWLEIYSVGGLDLYFVAVVLESEVLPYNSTRKIKLLHRVTTRVETHFGEPYILSVIAKNGMNTDPKFRTKYVDWLSGTLAEGRLAYAYQINYLVSDSFFGKNAFGIEEVAPLAFDKAMAAGNFGIAAALVLQFGEEKCFDQKILSGRAQGKNKRERQAMLRQLVEERKTQIRESFGVAKVTKQPVRFDYECSFLKSY